jgi:DTW domain-containing protein YfiP
MQTTQHSNTRCPAYLHPSACNCRASVEAIQSRTGLLVITTSKGRTEAIKPLNTAVADDSSSPFGGDAA